VDDLGHGNSVLNGDENIRRFDVAMDDPFLVCMLDGAADLEKKLEPLGSREFVLVAEVCDPDAGNELHYKIRPARIRGAGFEDSRDVWVIHQRQRLSFAFKSRDDLLRIHPELDDLDRDPAPERLLLLGEINHTHAATAKFLQEF